MRRSSRSYSAKLNAMRTILFFKLSFGIFLAWNALAQIFARETWWFIQNVNLIFHEAGHLIFLPFPDLITLLAGSAFEIGVPLAVTLSSSKNTGS